MKINWMLTKDGHDEDCRLPTEASFGMKLGMKRDATASSLTAVEATDDLLGYLFN